MSLEHSWKMPHRGLSHGIFILTLCLALTAPAFPKMPIRRQAAGHGLLPQGYYSTGMKAALGSIWGLA